MQKPTSLVLFAAIVAAVATAVVLYPRFANDHAAEADKPIPDAASSPIAASADSAAGPSTELAPERGLWPGLPPIATTELIPYSHSEDFDRGPVAVDDAEDNDEVSTLLELEKNFDDLPISRRGSAAARIAEGWGTCRTHRPLTADEMEERIESRFRSSLDFATSIIAQAPDSPEVDAAIEEMAGADPDDVRAQIRADELLKQQFCRGVENVDPRERMDAELAWLRKGARLGHYGAQYTFLQEVFSHTRSSGKAAELAEDKQLVLDIMAVWLQRHDLHVLAYLARFIGEGYFGQPDPMLGYAHALAAIMAAERLAQSPWRLLNPEPERVQRFIASVRFNNRALRRDLSASELARAEDIAMKIARLEPDS